MVPKRKTAKLTMESFPRASGDGPLSNVRRGFLVVFPPRERGWSPDLERQAAFRDVSPARAGMVPRRGMHPARSRSFPRASGDGPSSGLPWASWSWFPPRERGWSPSGTLHVHAERVSPARAGMVPRQRRVL